MLYIQQSEESNCWLEQSPENRLYRLFRSFWATLYSNIFGSWLVYIIICNDFNIFGKIKSR